MLKSVFILFLNPNIFIPRPCAWLTVLMGLELELGQTVDQIIEKRFSGDFRLGLKVLGKHSLTHCLNIYCALHNMIRWRPNIILIFVLSQYSAFKTVMPTLPRDLRPWRWDDFVVIFLWKKFIRQNTALVLNYIYFGRSFQNPSKRDSAKIHIYMDR